MAPRHDIIIQDNKNQQEREDKRKTTIEKDQTNQERENLIGQIKQNKKHFSDKRSEVDQKISEEITECENGSVDLENIMVKQKELIEGVKEGIKFVRQNADSMHKTLLQNNNSKSKCITDVSIGGGAITMACGTFAALAFNPTFGIFGILGGIAFLYGLARKASGCHGHLYKKPNSAVESIDIEQGMNKSLQGMSIN